MSVDITQDEMNILNLNGISVEDVKSNIDYLRATGIDDSAIRQQYSETINELKPITKQSANDTGKIKEWKNKGGVTPFEYAQNRAIEFNGTYNNIDNNVNFNPVEQALRNSPRNEAVRKKIEENFRQKQERNKRVNEGTASFWDRAGAALDRMGNASYQAQVNAPADPIVKNIIESQNTTEKTGKINFTESLGNSFASGEWIPFIGGFIGGTDDKKEREIQEKIRNSQPIRQDELNYLNYRLNKRQEENVRGYTWGGQIADGILPSMIRFSGEIATGQWVLKGLGLMPELASGATTGQTALYHLGNIAKGGAANTLLPTGWNDTYQTLQNRLLNNGMEFTDKGSYIFKEATEKPAISFLKSLGQTFVEFASEYSGGLLGMPVKGLSAATAKYIGTPISKYLASQPKLTKFVDKALPELAKRYEILNKLKPQGKTYEFLKDMTRFDGFLEELGEEVVADVLNLTLGTGDQERTLENYAKAVFKSPDEWAVLAGAIALQGGTLSVASHVLGNYMERNGASDDEILEVMNSLSEREKEKKISELTTEGLIDVSSYANEDMQQRKELQNRYYTQLKNAGREDDEALQTANVFSEIVANSAKEWGISLDDAEKKFAINLQNMTDEQAYEQYKQDEATLLQGRVEYNNSKIIDDKIDQLFAEYDNLPEDFSDETELNNRVGEMQLLQDIKDGTLADIDKSRAEALISNYEQSEPQLAAALKAALNNSVNRTTIQPKFQSIETAGAENNQTAVARKEWETKGTDSRFFKKWFGDSKVVDESGQPLVVYHGTNADFETFDQSKIGTATDMGIWGKGFYFGNKETPYGTKQMPVYLKIDNPFVINDFKTIEEIADYLDVSEFNFRLDSDGLIHFAQDQINQITSHIKEKGHDGIIMRSGDWSEYVVFEPEQIKSVNNKGTFDTENPNIYFQRKRIRTSPGQISLNFENVLQMNLFQQEQIFVPQETDNQPVQLKIKSSYTESDVTTPKTTEQINDVGDSLLGNLKKNKKQYTWAELENMNDLLRSKYVAKKYIVQIPTFQELKEQGLSDRSAAYVLYVYSKINSKPASGYDNLKSQKTYYDFVNEVVEKTIQFAKDNNELITNLSTSQFNNDLFKRIFPNSENKPISNVFRAYPEYNYKAVIVGGNKFVNSLYLDYQSSKDIDKLVKAYSSDNNDNKKATENLTGWQKKFEVNQNYRGWFIADRKSGMIISSTNLPSKEIAELYAQKIYDYLQANQNSFTVDFSKMRNYIPRRQNNQNVRPEALIEVFGFRGINFGNWTKQSERQDFVNLAYDSLYDLAEILNIPPKALSLGGKLGLAFGAQGRSHAAGHFIPEYNEINLTRKSGAGSLAHEWWHALDYYFGDQSKGKDFSGTPALTLKAQGFLREDIYNALSEIREQMKFAPLTENELNTKKNIMKERIEHNIEYYANDIKKSFRKSKHSAQINSFIDDILNRVDSIDIKAERDELDKKFVEMLEERRRTFDNLSKLNNLEYQILKLQQVEALAQASKKYTNYYNNAAKLNQIEKGSGNYWTQDTELGARAFASYILNKINQKQYTNHFLVQDEALQYSFDLSAIAERIQNQTENKDSTDDRSLIVEWFPADTEERKRIFDAFDRLFSKVQIRNENNNLILFQSIDDSNDLQNDINNVRGYTYQRYNFDGTMKDNLITLLNKKADKSTLLHEFAHVYLITLNNMARENERAREMLLNVNKWLRYDGIEYTVAQHEKFANGFVAYVRSGKAPTYGLKRAFENFKKWLNDLYSTLVNAEDFFLDPETEQVFEDLLGGSIHNAQKQEAEQLLYKAKRYAELRFDDEGLKTTINPNQLTERQRRYRDTAYDIIYYALQHSKEGREFIKSKKQLQMILGNKNTAYGKKNKGIKHQAERIYEFLSELDDEFSANDGFLPEWGEFFNDPGVSYNNAEAGADSELALEAYDVIVENRYLYDTENVDEFGILTEEEAQKNQYELEALLDAYKNADDKTIPMLAYYEWFDRLHPYIQEDIEKKWESETNEIDRYQSLSKFEQAKEDLKLYAATLKGYGDYSSQFAEYARAILKRLDFMTEYDKARIFDKLKEYNSFRDIERNLDTVMDFAETLADVSMRKQLAADIDREVRQTIHEWQNGIKKTKYTYPANKLFTRLRELNRMKIDTLQDMYDQIVNEEANITYEADTVNDNDYYKVIEEMFIKYRINGSLYNTTEFLKDLLDKIQNAKFTAKLARDEIDFERRMQNINLIDECARAVDTHKGKVSKLEQAYRHGFNLNSALEMMFNKEIKNKFTLDYLYAMKDAQVGADRNEVLEKIAKVFGYTGRFRDIQLFNRFIDMTKKEFKIKQRYTPDKVNGTYRVTHTDPETGKTFTDRVVNVRKDSYEYKEWDEEPIELSRMELLYYYIQSKNSISYKMLTDMGDETTPPKGQFDKFEFDQLLNELTEQEKMMGDILQMAAEKYYPQLNQYHIKKYHTDLGKVNAYFPRKSETQDVKMLEMFNQYSQLNTNQRMQKQRTAGPGVRIAPANPVAVLFDHIEKANTLIIMGEQLDIMNSVFKDSDLQKKIKTVWGDDTAKEFMQLVTANLYSGQQSTISEAESFIGKIENNVIKAQIFLKPQVGLKQVMSFMNYGVGDEYVSAGEWWKKFAQQTFTPTEWKNNINYMMNIPYLKDRFGRGGSTDALKRQLEQRMFAKISLFDEIFSANVRYGDMGAIILGGKPYIDCLLDKGYSEEQAIRIFIEKTVNDQQSSIPSTLSNIQRNAAHQPLAKMFFAYQNTPWQYFRTASNAIIRFKQNPSKETGLNMIKLVGCYMFLFPFLFNLASSLSPIIAATGGGDDELKEDFWKSIIGGVTFVPIAGMFINTIYSGIRGERATTGNWFDTAAAKLGNTARKINKGDITPKDLFNAISLFTEASTGVPMTSIGTEVSGAADVLTGSPLKGLLKLSGFTDYRAKRVTGEK